MGTPIRVLLAVGVLGSIVFRQLAFTASGDEPAAKAPAAPGASGPGTATASAPAKLKPYVVHRAAGAITIDAKDHPDEWKNAEGLTQFWIPVTYEKPKSRTEAKMLWDDENLYFWFIAYDQDLRGTLKGKLANLWTEDVVEFFFSPDFQKGCYYELELAPTNELLALQIENTRRGSFEERANWEHHIKTAVGVEGTLNDPGDADKYFRGVLAIPWKDLKFAGNKPPKVGDAWRFNVPRCDLSKQFDNQQELSACVPLPKIDFHISDAYGTMIFQK